VVGGEKQVLDVRVRSQESEEQGSGPRYQVPEKQVSGFGIQELGVTQESEEQVSGAGCQGSKADGLLYLAKEKNSNFKK
jgi:hypothetical protein